MKLALRIALAARALPGTHSRQVMEILFATFGKPITVRKLSRLRFNQFKKLSAEMLGEKPEKLLRQAFSYLQGKGIDCEPDPLPTVIPYREGDIPGSIRLACTSDNGHLIDGQFANCEHFLIYQVGADEYRLIDIRTQPESGTFTDPDHDKHSQRAAIIGDCHVLCTTVIGGLAAAKVVKAGIHPMRVKQPVPAPVFIREIQQVLRHNTPPWLLKVMARDAEASATTVRKESHG
jgi:nitrogen fixation protein NifX